MRLELDVWPELKIIRGYSCYWVERGKEGIVDLQRLVNDWVYIGSSLTSDHKDTEIEHNDMKRQLIDPAGEPKLQTSVKDLCGIDSRIA